MVSDFKLVGVAVCPQVPSDKCRILSGDGPFSARLPFIQLPCPAASPATDRRVWRSIKGLIIHALGTLGIQCRHLKYHLDFKSLLGRAACIRARFTRYCPALDLSQR